MWFFPGFGFRPGGKVTWSEVSGPEGVYELEENIVPTPISGVAVWPQFRAVL